MKLFNVLFIDDKFETLLPAFNMAVDALDINLLTANSIIRGDEILSKYSTVINAIILDLCFPKDEMQGKEGLRLIKKKYPFIPVIVLTKSDTADDLQTAVLCIKYGAYDYVGKTSLNPAHLFHIVENAIKQSRLEIKASIPLTKTEQQCNHQPYVKTDNNEGSALSKYLAYKLESISVHSDIDKLAEIKRNATSWHNYFIEVLLPAFSPYLLLSLIYSKGSEGNIDIFVVFRIQRKNENDLEKLCFELQHDLQTYFNSAFIDNPYSFSPVEEKDQLNRLISSDFQGETMSLYKKPLLIEARIINIGFGKTRSDNERNQDICPSFPLLLQNQDDKSFVQSLMNASGSNMICCHIKPNQLQAEDIEHFNKFIIGAANLPAYFTHEEKSSFINYISELIRQSSSCFLGEVRIISEKASIDRHLVMSVAEYFFGGIKNVQQVSKKSLFDLIFSISEDVDSSTYPYLYINQDLRNIFRLPEPQVRSYQGLCFYTIGAQTLPHDIAKDGIKIGVKNFSSTDTEVFIDSESAKKHVYILGQTGTGKSTILKTMIMDAMRSGHGLCVIDPHGDLFEEIRNNVPSNRKKDLLCIDTNDIGSSQKLNLFETDSFDEAQKTTVISEIGRILSNVYDMKNAGGPLFETYFRNAAFLAMDEAVVKVNGPATLADAYRIIMDDEFRVSLLSHATNPKIKTEFKAIEKTSGEYAWANFKPYITSKFNLFLENEYLNKLFNHKGETLNFRQVMDEGKILIVRLDKGQIGVANLTLAGMIFLNKLILAIMSRSDLPKEKRREFFVFIDEFQNFLRGDIGSALSEVRKYNVGMILANQTLGQLDDYMIQSVLGNVGSTIFFRPGLNDYFKISHYFEPTFTKEEVLNLPNFNCIARLMHNHKPCKPFVFQTSIE